MFTSKKILSFLGLVLIIVAILVASTSYLQKVESQQGPITEDPKGNQKPAPEVTPNPEIVESIYSSSTATSTVPLLRYLSDPIKSYIYRCDDSKQFMGRFETGKGAIKAQVFFQDGTPFSLTQKATPSGVQYVNKEGTFSLFTKDGVAFIQQGAMITYKNCIN
ncbi:MAG: hypothetical protein RL094_815 [Candidatus Parcubacteria bacterium]|jgi:membrane-bound inhibitor of C-type lysozyme